MRIGFVGHSKFVINSLARLLKRHSTSRQWKLSIVQILWSLQTQDARLMEHGGLTTD
jgi:hypothetical protein